MKKITLLALAAVAFTACNSKKTEMTTNTTDTIAVEAPAVEQEAKTIVTVTGTVTEIQQGKDGITAKVKDDNGKFYSIVISIINLKDKNMYRPVKVGDIIKVNGEQWEMNGETHIKANTLEI